MSENGSCPAKYLPCYSCSVCNKSFSQLNKLTQHKKDHESEYAYKCSTCGKAFAQKHVLDVHIARKHAVDKQHKCDQCGQEFGTFYDLQRHVKTHTGSKPYNCDSCDKAFSTSGDLRRHKRIHTGEKPYQCEVCARPFARVGSCLRHQKVHFEGKKHQCDICHKSYTRPWNLLVHKRSHTGEKPYCCDKCTQSFCFFRELQSHKKIHMNKKHGKKTIDEGVSSAQANMAGEQKTHKCGACGKKLARKRLLQQHLKDCKESSSSGLPEHQTSHLKAGDEVSNRSVLHENISITKTTEQMMKKTCNKAGPSTSDDINAFINQQCEGVTCDSTQHFKYDDEESADYHVFKVDKPCEMDEVTCDTAFVCSLCGASFETSVSLSNHITDTHQDV